MGCACSNTRVADGIVLETNPEEAKKPIHNVKKSSGESISAVEKSLAKREKSMHLDAVAKRSILTGDLSKEDRKFERCTSIEIASGTPEDALHELVKGNARFILGDSENPHQEMERLTAIAPKQNPFAAVLACADSRAPVEIIFDQGFGDIFCCRIAGNIASAEQIASLEYAVMELGVKVIMVMGHTSCGAVKAACSGKTFPGFIDMLVNSLDVAVARAQTNTSTSYKDLIDQVHAFEDEGHQPSQELIERVIRENVIHQVNRCSRSTIILEAIKKKRTILVPALYHIDTGEVELLDHSGEHQ